MLGLLYHSLDQFCAGAQDCCLGFAICQIRQLLSTFEYFSKVSFGTLFGDIGSDGHLFLQNREGENLGVYKV